jgi:cytochrome c-type biogenesis protein CcmH/NrfF
MDIANTFILWVIGAAAFMTVAAVVQKRHRRRTDEHERSSNLAS